MKATYILFLSFITSNILLSQREDANWILGYNNGVGDPYGISKISFDTILQSLPIMDTLFSPIELMVNNAIISDKNGNVLFYTNGVVIMNGQNDTMQNGTGLSPCTYTTQHENYGLNNIQGSLILPVPNNNHLYYLFHETIASLGGEPYADKLLYSIIDMNEDNGKGAVIQKNVPILSNKQLGMGKITACKHANGRDWWIIKSDFYADKYYKFLFQADGLHGPYIQTFNDTIMHVMSNDPDQSGFTPDGSKYIHSCARSEQKVFIFDFDRCTGELSYRECIHTKGLKKQYEIGCTFFSPNSQYMYFSAIDSLYQYDFSQSPINSTRQFIAAYDGFSSPIGFSTSFFTGITAPNGKIYIGATNGCDWLHVINHPDSAGTKCGFQQHSVQLPKIVGVGLPNFPNYHLGAMVGSACDTITSISNPIETSNVYVYPNPVQNTLHIGTNHIQGEIDISITNHLGQILYAQKSLASSQEKTFYMTTFPPGIYYLRIFAGDKLFTQKIVKE